MSFARMKLKNAFVDIVVPVLAKRGFEGVFPNYRRYTDRQVDIISLQFSLFDEAFCVGIAKCPIEGVKYRDGETIPGHLVTANHCPQRFMLGTQNGDSHHWFKFNPSSRELKNQNKFSYLSIYEDSFVRFQRIADDIVKLFELQAESWWRDSEEWWLHGFPIYNKLFFDLQLLQLKRLS